MANEFMCTLIEHLEKHFNTRTVIGEPTIFGDITLIPVMDLMFGVSGGAGEGRDEKNRAGTGTGGGMGARLSPKAIIVIKDGETQVMPLGRGSAIDKIFEAIPGMMEKFGAMKRQMKVTGAEPKTGE